MRCELEDIFLSFDIFLCHFLIFYITGWEDKPIHSTKLHRNLIKPKFTKSIDNTYLCLFSHQNDVTPWRMMSFGFNWIWQSTYWKYEHLLDYCMIKLVRFFIFKNAHFIFYPVCHHFHANVEVKIRCDVCEQKQKWTSEFTVKQSRRLRVFFLFQMCYVCVTWEWKLRLSMGEDPFASRGISNTLCIVLLQK